MILSDYYVISLNHNLGMIILDLCFVGVHINHIDYTYNIVILVS